MVRLEADARPRPPPPPRPLARAGGDVRLAGDLRRACSRGASSGAARGGVGGGRRWTGSAPGVPDVLVQPVEAAPRPRLRGHLGAPARASAGEPPALPGQSLAPPLSRTDVTGPLTTGATPCVPSVRRRPAGAARWPSP